MSFARGIVLEHMLRTEKSAVAISTFELRYEEDVKNLKKRSVDLLLDLHPEFFQRLLDFETWEEASQHVDAHRDIVFKFWEK